ncbi:hypothetical protein HC928_18275 [bacterium]|nr:hypothetical protein [bacterium]
MTLNLNQLRGVNPVYTKFAQGYVPTGNPVADFIAPAVKVPTRAGNIVTFGKESFAIENTKRAPGSTIQRISPEYSFKEYSVQQDALAATVYAEHLQETSAVNMQGLEIAAVRQVLDKLELGREKAVLDLVKNPANYESTCTGSGSKKWGAVDSDPLADILKAKNAVRAQIGAMPNSMVVSPKVYNALISHAKIQAHYSPTTSDVLDDSMIARYFRLSRGLRVAERVQLDRSTGKMLDLLDEEAILFYAPPAASAGTLSGAGNPFSRFDMSFAYQYVLDGYPSVANFEFERNTQSWVAPVIYENTPVISGVGATGKAGGGFLFTNLLTP